MCPCRGTKKILIASPAGTSIGWNIDSHDHSLVNILKLFVLIIYNEPCLAYF